MSLGKQAGGHAKGAGLHIAEAGICRSDVGTGSQQVRGPDYMCEARGAHRHSYLAWPARTRRPTPLPWVHG